MNTDCYLKIDGITGESMTEGFTGQIELSSWSWSANNPARVGSATTGFGTGRVALTELQCSAGMSTASNFLFEFCATGKHLTQAILTARQAGGEQEAYYVITLEGVFVTSYSTSGSKGDDRPFDNFSLAFNKISIDYRQQNANTGKPSGSSSKSSQKSWDLRTNQTG
jgi:type VI secretion system secreted protein Hcp